MKFVKDITLLTILGNKDPSFKENFRVIDKILDTSYNYLRFEKIKILSAFKENYQFKDKEVIIEEIEPMSQRGYNIFCLNNLTDYIDTKYVLIFQNDGFIINPHLWEDSFLDYDYIGAPWPDHLNSRIGNGGFSLRTKKLIDITKNIKYIDNIGLSGGTCSPEDHLICRYYYEYLKMFDIKFAPLDVAIRFSYEQYINEFPNWNNDLSLGFHGLFQNGWQNDSFRKKIKEKYYT